MVWIFTFWEGISGRGSPLFYLTLYIQTLHSTHKTLTSPTTIYNLSPGDGLKRETKASPS